MRPTRTGIDRLVTLLAALILAACIDSTVASGSASPVCKQQVIVTLTDAPAGEPDSTLVADLAKSAGAELTYLRAVSANTFVFSLTAGSETGCRDALGRLRQDSRVRSAEVDATRKAHTP